MSNFSFCQNDYINSYYVFMYGEFPYFYFLFFSKLSAENLLYLGNASKLTPSYINSNLSNTFKFCDRSGQFENIILIIQKNIENLFNLCIELKKKHCHESRTFSLQAISPYLPQCFLKSPAADASQSACMWDRVTSTQRL